MLWKPFEDALEALQELKRMESGKGSKGGAELVSGGGTGAAREGSEVPIGLRLLN